MAVEADDNADVAERRAEHLEAIVGRRVVILLVEFCAMCTNFATFCMIPSGITHRDASLYHFIWQMKSEKDIPEGWECPVKKSIDMI